ncbi:hypothetical protein E2C01_032111 [Portunus trituberculatus]|uniref:Uncharacterized protein n=1 Tax=Portunus trituberculatus TaxID=210409 RepID=A0A5B7EV69_PORTR|nr:hypothetical protein [Portunus trituberculatus]
MQRAGPATVQPAGDAAKAKPKKTSGSADIQATLPTINSTQDSSIFFSGYTPAAASSWCGCLWISRSSYPIRSGTSQGQQYSKKK